MSAQAIVKETEEKMKRSLEAVQHNFAGVRTGRANAGMVENLRVDYYGASTPMKQVAGISIPEPRLIILTPWDPTAIKAIEKAINESDLGLTPVVDGKGIKIAIPALTRERRDELVKITHKVAEEGRVTLRTIRRDGNDKIKLLEKDKTATEDESFKAQAEIQKLTDRYIQLIDQAQAAKEKDLTQT
jgi:ribosome recycling factor